MLFLRSRLAGKPVRKAPFLLRALSLQNFLSQEVTWEALVTLKKKVHRLLYRYLRNLYQEMNSSRLKAGA
jgi:hypothetical protein